MSNLVSYAISSDSDEDTDESDASLHGSCRKRVASLEKAESSVKQMKTHNEITAANSATVKLPLPDDITNMFTNDPGYKEDQSLHQGRARSFPHERGNWASYVFVPFDDEAWCRELATSVIQCLRPEVEFNMVDHFHVSLSRTVVLRHHWIEPLVSSLREKLSIFSRTLMDFSTVEFYCNDERSRTFLGMKVGAGSDSLKRYTSAVNKSFEEFRLPKYYDDPSFHMSLVWALEDVRDKIKPETKSKLQRIIDEYFCAHPRISVAGVKDLQLKTGNKNYSLNLNCR